MVLEVKSPPSSGLLNLEKGKGEKKGGGGGEDANANCHKYTAF